MAAPSVMEPGVPELVEPGQSPSSSQVTPHFALEPPTPTAGGLLPHPSTYGAGDKGQAPQHYDANGSIFDQPHDANGVYTPGDALRASPVPSYSRHHPYAHSASSYGEDLGSAPPESLDGGAHRNGRTSYAHQSHSPFDGEDPYGQHGPAAYDETAAFAAEMAAQAAAQAQQPNNGRPTKEQRAKEPIRLTATGKPSHARRLPPGHIKRPRNAFILFRSHACVNNLVPQQLGITDHRHISRIVGQMWKSLPPEERKIWEEQAEKEKEEHRRAHPDYKYRPVYRREGVVRRRRRKPQDDKEVEEEERKCEVVARVLLEGGEISEERVEKEIEIQRERDEIEGRVRGPAARSPSRGPRRQVSAPLQHPPFDMQYGLMHYGQPMYDAYNQQQQATGARRGQPQRQSSLNVRYDYGDGAMQGIDGQDGGAAGGVDMQRAQTMPPYYDDAAAQQYYQQQGQAGQQQQPPPAGMNGRAAPPMPLSLYGDASLAPPASPGALFRAGTDPSAMQGLPATPRTLAMQQHSLSLQQRLRGNTGSLLSPRGSTFGLGMSRDDATLVSPSRPFHHDQGLGFGDGSGFLDPNGGEAAGQQGQRAGSEGLAHGQRSLSADDASRYQGGESGQQNYSALGEIAAGSSGDGQPPRPGSSTGGGAEQPPATSGADVGISFRPEADVAYVFLDAKQAQDQALVDSIRAQGFGITLDASQEEIAALTTSGPLAAR